jgi:hypothetical protein
VLSPQSGRPNSGISERIRKPPSRYAGILMTPSMAYVSRPQDLIAGTVSVSSPHFASAITVPLN